MFVLSFYVGQNFREVLYGMYWRNGFVSIVDVSVTLLPGLLLSVSGEFDILVCVKSLLLL